MKSEKQDKAKRPYTITKKPVNISLHMGKEIRSIVKMKGYKTGYVWAALGIQRGTLYQIYKTKMLSTENLIALGKVIDFDFFEYFSNKLYGSKDRVIAMYESRDQLYKQKIEVLEQKILLLELQLKNKEVKVEK